MKYFLILITLIYSTTLLSQAKYWNDIRKEELRRIISKSMSENQINLPNSNKKSEYIDCVISKVTYEFPTEKEFNLPSAKQKQRFKEIYQECVKETFGISNNKDIVKADIVLDWSEMNTSTLKNTLLKRFSKEFSVEVSNERLVAVINCAIEKLKISYPKGINPSTMNMSQFQDNINQYIHECLQSKINP